MAGWGGKDKEGLEEELKRELSGKARGYQGTGGTSGPGWRRRSGKATDMASASENGQNLLDRVSLVFIA